MAHALACTNFWVWFRNRDGCLGTNLSHRGDARSQSRFLNHAMFLSKAVQLVCLTGLSAPAGRHRRAESSDMERLTVELSPRAAASSTDILRKYRLWPMVTITAQRAFVVLCASTRPKAERTARSAIGYTNPASRTTGNRRLMAP
jgi:hypothetical protein